MIKRLLIWHATIAFLFLLLSVTASTAVTSRTTTMGSHNLQAPHILRFPSSIGKSQGYAGPQQSFPRRPVSVRSPISDMLLSNIKQSHVQMEKAKVEVLAESHERDIIAGYVGAASTQPSSRIVKNLPEKLAESNPSLSGTFFTPWHKDQLSLINKRSWEAIEREHKDIVHGATDVDEMLEELAGDVLIDEHQGGDRIKSAPDETLNTWIESWRSDPRKADDTALSLDFLKEKNKSSDLAGRNKSTILALARKTLEGEIVVAAQAEHLDFEVLASLASLEDLIPSQPKGITGIKVKAEPGIYLSRDGALEIPAKADERDLAIARGVTSLIDAKPHLKSELPLLGHVTDADITHLNFLERRQASSYIQFRATEVPEGYALADLRVSANNPKLVLATRGGINVIPTKISEELETYVEKVYAGDEHPTRSEFINRTRPMFEVLKEVLARSKAAHVITVEDSLLSAALIWAIHGGDPKIDICRDQVDVKASLTNAQKVVPAPGKESIVVSTRPVKTERFDSPVGKYRYVVRRLEDSPQAQEIINDLEAYLVWQPENITWNSFKNLLNDPNRTHITVIADGHGRALMFPTMVHSETVLPRMRVQYKEISEALTDIPHKRFIHIVTNGGPELVRVFADSGKFDRVLLSQWQYDNQDSFELALENVRSFYSLSGEPFAVLTPHFQIEAVRDPELYQALLNATWSRDGKSFVAIRKLLTEIRRTSPEKIKDISSRLQKHLQIGVLVSMGSSSMVLQKDTDIDRIWRDIVTDRLKSLKLFGGRQLTLPYRLAAAGVLLPGVTDRSKTVEAPPKNYEFGEILRSIPIRKCELNELYPYA